MKAKSQTTVRTGDPESGTTFLEGEHAEWSKYEDAVLRELYDEVSSGDLTQDQLDAVEEFVDLVRERRTRHVTTLAARKARLAGVRK